MRRDDAPASGVRPGGILPDFPAAVRRPLRQRNPPLQRPVRRCVPSFGAGQSPCPTWGFQGGFGPISGQASGRGPRGDEEQEKTLALLCARAVTSARSAGGFGDLELALFRPVGFGIGAVLVKSRLNPRRCGISGGADEKRRRFWR